MTIPDPVLKTPYRCPKPSTLRILNRLRKTELGSPENRLCIGCFELAYYDGVLLIENGSITHNMANLEPDALRVVLGKQQIVIDVWLQSSYSVTLCASTAEMEHTRAYFTDRGITVCSA